MSGTGYYRSSHIGFLGLCEGVMLGLYAGWWLQIHGQSPVAYMGAGVAAAGAFFLLQNASRDSALATPLVLISMGIWGFVGWNLGAYAFQSFGVSLGAGTILSTILAWRIVLAIAFAVVAFANKASMGGAR